jgi:hypothetical protein
LEGYSDAGPVQLLAAPIAWTANQAHQVCLDYGVQTALFIDGQLAAQGAATVAIPLSVGKLVFGSDLAGDEVAGGAIDEFFTFDHPLSAEELSLNYRMTSRQAALGPVSAKELAEENEGSGLTLTKRESVTRVYDPDNAPSLSPGGPVYLTNFSASVAANGTTTWNFSVGGGTNGVFYDLYYVTDLLDMIDNTQWTWVALDKRPLRECSGVFSLGRIEVQATQVEKDVGFESFFAPIAKRLFDQPLDFVV